MDHAASIRRSLIASADVTPQSSADDQIKAMQYRLGQKRVIALNALGTAWVHHPEYDPSKHPHHATCVRQSATLAVINATARFEGRI